MTYGATTSFEYDKIRNNEFRLLSFKSTDCSSPLDVNLEVKCLRTGQRPAYEAISYVWGDIKETGFILVNGKAKEVRRNLVQILMLLRQRLSEQALFWVDALCINQEDQTEKNYQIQVMGPIYKFAEIVHIFPARDIDSAALNAKELSQFSAQFAESCPPGSLISDSLLRSRGLPTTDDLIWHKMRDFFQLPWFQRLWVVQEAVLANELVVHFSDGTISWMELVDLVERLKRFGTGAYTEKSVDVTHCQRSQNLQNAGFLVVQMIEKVRSKYIFQHSLIAILVMVSTKLCHDPMDRVYAWYWLLPESLRSKVTPRYRISAQLPFWIPFIELSHIALDEYRCLSCLPLACTIERLPQLPSWCINTQSAREIDVYSGKCNAGGILSTEIAAHIATSRDARRIYLRGFEICKITKIFDLRWMHCVNSVPHPSCIASWVEWVHQCLLYVKTIPVAPEQLLRTLILDMLDSPAGSSIALTDLQKHYRDLIDYWCARAASRKVELDNAAVMRAAQMELLFTSANKGRRLLVTSLGNLCLGHHKAETGDLVCVFEGAAAPFLLRRKQPSESIYTFVSDAWVYGFMNGEAFQQEIPVQTFIVE